MGYLVGLQPPAETDAGHTAHDQRRRYYGNAGVIGHRQLVFNL